MPFRTQIPGWHDYLWDLYIAMKKDLTTEYPFRTYSVWAGIALLAFLLPLAYGMIVLLKYLGLETIHESVLKVALIFLTVGWLLLIRRWITVVSVAQLNSNGLVFINLPRYLHFSRTDHFIFWNEIEDWQVTESEVSAHSFAPKVFTIRLSGRRKIEILVAEEAAFNRFLADFRSKTATYNLQNRAVAPIESRPIDRPGKPLSYLFISLIFLTIVGLMLAMGLGYLDGEKASELQRLGYVGGAILFLMLWGIAMKAIYVRKD